MIVKYVITALILATIALSSATSTHALSSMSSSALSIATSSVVISNGLIGVGTPTPQYTLDVYGDFRVSANISGGRGNVYSTMVTVNGTVDWSAGPYQVVVVGSGGISLSFIDPLGPCTLWLLIQRTGSGVISFPDVTWINAIAPSLSSSESAGGTVGSPIYDVLELYYDGTNYYGAVYLNFKT